MIALTVILESIVVLLLLCAGSIVFLVVLLIAAPDLQPLFEPLTSRLWELFMWIFNLR